MAQKKVKTGVQLGKAARRKALDEMEAWWDAEVGEFPADLDSSLGLFLKSLPVEIVWDALRRAAQDDALQDSEDVLERVKQNVAQVRAPPLQKVTDPAEFGLKVQIERLLEWWDEEVGERPANLEELIGNLCRKTSVEVVKRALQGARAKKGSPEEVLESARKDLRVYRRMRRRRKSSPSPL